MHEKLEDAGMIAVIVASMLGAHQIGRYRGINEERRAQQNVQSIRKSSAEAVLPMIRLTEDPRTKRTFTPPQEH